MKECTFCTWPRRCYLPLIVDLIESVEYVYIMYEHTNEHSVQIADQQMAQLCQTSALRNFHPKLENATSAIFFSYFSEKIFVLFFELEINRQKATPYYNDSIAFFLFKQKFMPIFPLLKTAGVA